MITVRYFAQDVATKKKTNSSIFYFEILTFEVMRMIEYNRVELQKAMPHSRIFIEFSNTK